MTTSNLDKILSAQDEAAIQERLEELEKMIEEKYVTEDHINIYDLSCALNRQIEGDATDVKGPFLGGASLSGWYDPNKQLRPEDLIGKVYDAGLLTELRYASDIVAPIMDDAEAAIASIEYDIVPREENASQSQKLAAEAIKTVFDSMPYLSLERFISTVWDQSATYGFSLWEMQMPTTGPNAFKFMIHNIVPWQVEWFELSEDRHRLKGVRVNNGDGVITVPASKLAWFGDSQFASNYWGSPLLRPVISAYSAYKEDIKNYLALRRLQKGVLVAKENGDGSNTASWSTVKTWMRRFYGGQSLPLMLNAGMDLDFLSVTQPGIDTYNNMLSYWDSKIRGALNSSLGNLGVDGVGSLALGQEVAANDRTALVNKTNRFLEFINGNTNVDSQLLAIMTELLGFNPHVDTPMIVALDNTEKDMSENATTLAGWIKDGVLDLGFIGEKNKRTMLESLGFDTAHLEPLEEGLSALSEPEYVHMLNAGPKKYSHIDFTPPKGAREAARRALDVRADKPASQRGMTAVGIARARDLENGKALSPKTVRRMLSFFSRHEVDKKGATWDEQGKGWQAWNGWGGNPGFSWAKKVVGQMNAADEKEA